MRPWMRIVAVVVLWMRLSTPAIGDLRQLEVTVLGMDCAVCAHGIARTLKRLDGVERAEVSLNRGTATITCRLDNTLTLGEISRAIRQNGFRPRQARVTAIGQLSLRDSVLIFELKRTRSVLSVEKDPANPEAYEATFRSVAAAKRSLTGELTGVSILGGDDVTSLSLHSFVELGAMSAH
jgi:copper chaperone CopZ